MAHMSFTGRLLVATPLIGDPHFERSVVLLLTHNDDGAFGLVLNRPTETPVADVVPDWAPHVTSPGRIFMGGPVAPDALVAIGRPAGGPTDLAAGEGDGFSPLVGGLASVDLGRPPTGEAVPWSELRLFAGSAGWAVGQLEGLRVRDGEVAEPIREAIVASTLQRMLADVIAVGDDESWFPIDAAGVSLSIQGLSLAARSLI